MSLSELMIDIPAEHEANVFGQFDAYAKKLERTFHVTLIARDGSMKIVGENTAAEKIGELISPAEIAKGTTVHFRATHSKSWTIMYWKVNGVIIRSVEPEQTFVIDEHKEVRVAFKPYKSPEPEGL